MLNQLVSEYLDNLRSRRLSPAHIVSVGYRLRRLTEGVGGETAVSAISADVIAAHLQSLEESGLAHATLAGQLSTIRAMWRWALDAGLVENDEVSRVSGHGYNYRPVRNVPASADDLAAVLRSLETYANRRPGHRDHACDVRDAALISLAADSAKRRGELHNLRVTDIEIALRRPQQSEDGVMYVAASHGKTGRVEVVFFEESARLLRRWLGLMPDDARWLFVSTRTGKRLRLNVMRLALRRVCQFVGVPEFGFHAIRKRTVTDAIEASGDTKVGQMLAGHADQRTTQIHYNSIDDVRVRRMAARLNRQRRGPGGGVLAEALFGGMNGGD